MKKKGILLLPGGGMSSWVWKSLVPLLDYHTITPEYRLPENTFDNRRRAKIADCVQYHISLIQELESVVIVAHSGGGVLASSIADTIPERIAGIMYISANIPKLEKSAIENLPGIIRLLNIQALRSQLPIDFTPLTKKERAVRKYFCNASTEEVIQYVIRQKLYSEPLCVAFEKVHWTSLNDIPKIYVILTKDKTQSVERQNLMASNLRIETKVQIESDHMVMLSQPEILSRHINDFAKVSQ